MEQEWINAVIDRITYTNPENGYSVLRVTTRGHPKGLTVVGSFSAIHAGEELRLCGQWVQHPQFGQQFHATQYSTLKPATLKGVEKYLGSGLIKGIGPVTAKRLVSAFGMETLEIIERFPERLADCPGIGPVRSKGIIAGWAEQKSIQDVMIFLQGHGVSTAYAVRIFKNFGNSSIAKVSENPYLLAYEIHGIGFKTADKIAGEFGITGSDPRRIQAGLLFVLSEASNDGHLFLPREDLEKKTGEILAVNDLVAIKSAFEVQVEKQRLSVRSHGNKELIYLPWMMRYEDSAVELLGPFLTAGRREIPREKLLAAIQAGVATGGPALAEQQQLAVELSLVERVLVLTGGPGTGKTTTLRAVVAAHQRLGRRVLLASPTGRAAKRLAEVSGQEAKTIHRLLEFSPQEHGFKHNSSNPLHCDTLVIDESSMIDMELFHHLLKAMPPRGTLIMVGDVDQLPSVGPGMVLKSLIFSEAVPTVRLQTIFRQAEASLIITNAHRILKGAMPTLITPDGQTKTDAYFLEITEPDAGLALLKNVVAISLPKRFGYHPIQDIQVLTPMHRGSLGAANLNVILQESLNPPAPGKNEFKHMHRVFRVGDKVIQMRNNYDLDVFNGDIGFIRVVEAEDQELVVEFPQGDRTYGSNEMLDLQHAFAISVHKSQGSEYTAVVLIVSYQHYMLLQRNLVYTGMTRAKKTLVLMGSKRALSAAVRNNRVAVRNTVLADLLAHAYGERMKERETSFPVLNEP
ncbi:MAG: ATP-dependent RecD-like DNA helicase [Candidatus Ozemobacteraceae bacterium]